MLKPSIALHSPFPAAPAFETERSGRETRLSPPPRWENPGLAPRPAHPDDPRRRSGSSTRPPFCPPPPGAGRGPLPFVGQAVGARGSPLPARPGSPPRGCPSRPRRVLAPAAAPHPWVPLPPPRSQGRGVGPAASQRFRPGHGPLPALRAQPVRRPCSRHAVRPERCMLGRVVPGGICRPAMSGCRGVGRQQPNMRESVPLWPGRPVTSWLVCRIV